MPKKKTATWYGIKTPRESLKIFEIEVIKEEPHRLLIDEKSLGPLSKPWVYKASAYEHYFPTREEAVAKKLEILEEEAERAEVNRGHSWRCLEDFRKQEGIDA